jgi:thiamine-phosphate pyrophosphorylase
MTTTPSSAPRGRLSPRLYLFTPALGEPAAFADKLAAVLDVGEVAAILLRLQDTDERTLVNRAKAVAAIAQPRGVALLLDGRAEIAARAGADGAHLDGIEALTAAIGALKPESIAGAGGLKSRHDAMLAAEGGADYVMFGEPDRRGNIPPLEAVEERLTWWAELFEAPCVGYAANPDAVGPLSQTGTDFIALGDWIWSGEGSPAASVAAAAASVAAAAASLAAPGAGAARD